MHDSRNEWACLQLHLVDNAWMEYSWMTQMASFPWYICHDDYYLYAEHTMALLTSKCDRLAESADSKSNCNYINLHTANAMWNAPPYSPHKMEWNCLTFMKRFTCQQNLSACWAWIQYGWINYCVQTLCSWSFNSVIAQSRIQSKWMVHAPLESKFRTVWHSKLCTFDNQVISAKYGASHRAFYEVLLLI